MKEQIDICGTREFWQTLLTCLNYAMEDGDWTGDEYDAVAALRTALTTHGIK